MFRVNEQEILDSPLDILYRLRSDLLLAGFDLIRGIKTSSSGTNIQFTCPVHNEGRESKPSCGITTRDNGDTKAGTVHCFTCGYTSNLEEFISRCFNKEDFGKFGRNWLIKNFIVAEVGERRNPLRIEMSREKRTQENQGTHTEEDLENYRFIHPYHKKRGLTEEILEKFDVGYDKKTSCITFPVRYSNSRLAFVARRSVKTKFFNYPADVQKPVYALDEIYKDRVFEEVIVCESFINALTCWKWGKPAIALLGLGNEYQYEELLASPIRKFILAFDGDDAGRKATLKFYNKLKGSKIVTKYVLPEGKDVNDLTEEEFRNLSEFYC